MQKFAGVPRGGGVKRQWGCPRRRFRWLFLPKLWRDKASVIIGWYAVPRRLFTDPQMSKCKILNDRDP